MPHSLVTKQTVTHIVPLADGDPWFARWYAAWQRDFADLG